MVEFSIPEMTCNHCVQTITRAVSAVDKTAKLTFDVPRHRLQVASKRDSDTIKTVIVAAGYSVETAPVQGGPAAK